MMYADRPNTLLVPIDLSENSRRVVVAAGRLAQSVSASILILHVLHETTNGTQYPRKSTARGLNTRLDTIASEMLKELLEGVQRGNPELEPLQSARWDITPGLPGNRICEVAERESPLMIVMGSHGRRGLAHFFMGSIAEQVLRNAAVPVTIIKNGTPTVHSDGTSDNFLTGGKESERALFL